MLGSNPIEEHGAIGGDNIRKFLADFVARFAHLVPRLAPVAQGSAA